MLDNNDQRQPIVCTEVARPEVERKCVSVSDSETVKGGKRGAKRKSLNPPHPEPDWGEGPEGDTRNPSETIMNNDGQCQSELPKACTPIIK